MYLPAPTESDFELTPAGTHLAICYRVLDLGTQKTTYQGEEKKQHKILISWELPDEKMKDGRPFTISQRYTWSMSDKATLRKHLEAWRGTAFTDKDFGPTGFNIKNILGKACLLTVTHTEKNDKKYANIAAVSKIMKGMSIPAQANESVYMWLVPELFEAEVFGKLGQGLQGVIMQSPEYSFLNSGSPADDIPPVTSENDFHSDDSVPF